jgi:hypothetical protein
MIGGVGQRMLSGVSRRMAAQFFGAVDGVLTGQREVGILPETAGPERVFDAPARAAGRAGPADAGFVRGALFGGALVLVGVLAGAVLARRRG